MLQITFEDEKEFNNLVENRIIIYKNPKYDFTFENRFFIYHADISNTVTYIAFDRITDRGSTLLTLKKGKIIQKEYYRKLIPYILKSIQYTGDTRFVKLPAQNPYSIIENVFRNVLPKYGYKVREEQIKLCLKMYEGITFKDVSICEAEVGTGKTLAFLIATIVAKSINNDLPHEKSEPITISTSNIELQKSLVEKDIPRISMILKKERIIKKDIIAVLRKGKEHYLCINRAKDYLSSFHKGNNKYSAKINDFIKNNKIDLDTFKIPQSVKDSICVRNCNAKCPYKKNCFYNDYIIQSLSFDIDVQVTNHNQYLMDRYLRSKSHSILNNSKYVIIDEAHKLKDTAIDVFGLQITEKDIPVYLNNIKNCCSQSNKEVYSRYIKEIRNDNIALFNRIKDIFESKSDDDEDVYISFSNEIKNLICKLKEEFDCLSVYQSDAIQSSKMLTDLLSEISEDINKYYFISKDENNVYSLRCVPKNIGILLEKHLWNSGSKFILTSGTMSDGIGFTYFKSRIGLNNLNDQRIIEYSTASPFDYEKHTRLYLPDNIPYPVNESISYIRAVSKSIIEIVDATNGHTAILFTSYKLLNSVYQLVEPYIRKYEVFIMSKSNNSVISDFKRSRNGVIFASGSMWEGVDISGDKLSSIIIVRLPFPIKDKVNEIKLFSNNSLESYIQKYAIPEMIIKLRQGVGRLIRSETDTGLISILDVRINKNRYSKIIYPILEKYPRIGSIGDIKEFFKTTKPKEYFDDMRKLNE